MSIENCTCYRSLEFPPSLRAIAIIAIGGVMSLDCYCRAISHYIFPFRSRVIWSFAILSPRIVSQTYYALVFSKCGLEPSLIIIAEKKPRNLTPANGNLHKDCQCETFVLQQDSRNLVLKHYPFIVFKFCFRQAFYNCWKKKLALTPHM